MVWAVLGDLSELAQPKTIPQVVKDTKSNERYEPSDRDSWTSDPLGKDLAVENRVEHG